MSRQPEHQRRKDTCSSCGEYKPIKAKGMCQNCWHKYKSKYDFRFFIRQRYSQIKQRCTNLNRKDYNNYIGKLQMTIDEFYDFSYNDTNLKKLWLAFQKDDSIYANAPSVDRIDSTKNYSIDNIQWIRHGDNSLKDQTFRPVTVYTRDGQELKSFDSLNDAVRYYDVQQANACKVLSGERKHTEGLVFKDRKNNA